MTVSCLPHFAQPYRVIANATIEAFFDGRTHQPDVHRWEQLLGSYRRTYHGWFRSLRRECGAWFGRAPPDEEPLSFLAPDLGRLWRPGRRHRQTGQPSEGNAFWPLPLPPASDLPSLERKAFASLLCRLIPTELLYGITAGQRQMLGAMTEKDPKSRLEQLALLRHSAVSWVEQSLNQGNTLGRALALAAALDWGGRRYSPRTLEGWFYAWRAQGFGALQRENRRDKGLCKAIAPPAAEAIVKLRLQQPSMPITIVVRQLQQTGVLQPGTFSLSSVYRLLAREGLDRPRLLAEGNGPTKAFETELTNALWMADVRDGPALRLSDRVVHTFLFALLDDCSRLVPHGQYYPHEKLRCLLDCLKQAFAGRGLPEKLYTDHGKIFTCAHLQVICANLNIKLIHARPYAAWSKELVSYCAS